MCVCHVAQHAIFLQNVVSATQSLLRFHHTEFSRHTNKSFTLHPASVAKIAVSRQSTIRSKCRWRCNWCRPRLLRQRTDGFKSRVLHMTPHLSIYSSPLLDPNCYIFPQFQIQHAQQVSRVKHVKESLDLSGAHLCVACELEERHLRC